MSKLNVPAMQNPNRVNVTSTKTLEEATPRLPGDTASP